MANIEKRIDKLENRLCTDDENKVDGVFYVPEDASLDAKPAEPVQCWSFNGQRITRQAGENDEDFRQRAIDEVKPSLGKMVVPVFMGE